MTTHHMPETLLLLVRHGATQANLARPYTLQGLRPDSDLAEAGVAQARAVAPALRTFAVTRAYCSPLKRARRTARLIADGLGVPLAVEGPLVEADVGLWSGLSWGEVERRWPAEYVAFREDPERHGYLGGENLAQVRDRALPAVERLAARHPGETLLIVSHGVVNRVLLAHWLGLPLRHARRLPQDNAGLNVVALGGDAAKVRTINAVAHLAELSRADAGRYQAHDAPPHRPGEAAVALVPDAGAGPPDERRP
jgi:broad specificity phosphatase PhoE